MKLISAIALCLCSICAFAQDGPPSANDIRNMIAGEIKSFNIIPATVSKVINRSIWTGTDSISIRLYYPSDAKQLPVVYNIHGGALIAGDLDTHDNISRVIATRTNSLVIAVDYRKPPEFPYPASIDDAYFILKWIIDNSAGIGADANSIVLTGDSGAGILITAIEVKMRQDKSNIPLKGIALVNPAVDLRGNIEGVYGLVTAMYLNKTNPNDSLVSPIIAKDYSRYPPTLVISSDKDILKPHALALVNKLTAAHKAIKYLNIPNEDHLGGFWAAAHPRAQPAIDEVVNFILLSHKTMKK